MSITIDREGAGRLLKFISNDDECWDDDNLYFLAEAIQALACGDDNDIRALLGMDAAVTESAPVVAEAPDFREGDRVHHCNIGDGWTVVEANGDTLRLERGPEGAHHAMAALCTLTHRRTFRAGECPPVAVGQERIDDKGPYRIMSRAEHQISVLRYGMQYELAWFAQEAESDPLAADFTFDAAVPVEVPNA